MKMVNQSIVSGIFLLLFAKIVVSDVFEIILDSESLCKEKCRNASISSSFKKNIFEESCDRGCRLFSMMEFMYDDMNRTTEVCLVACKEAYPKTEESDACKLGCESQTPFDFDDIFKNDPWENQLDTMGPFYYMHQLCNNVIKNIMGQGTVSWSLYLSDDNGVLLLNSSQFVVNNLTETNDKKSDDVSNTASYIETIIEPMGDSATSFVKNPAYTANGGDNIISISARDLYTEENMAASKADSWDWLSCVAKKTGLSRLILTLLLLMGAIVMIWLCLSAAATGPVQTVITQSKNLSINGDQEVIEELLARGIKPSYPQNWSGLNEFPVKLIVHRI